MRRIIAKVTKRVLINRGSMSRTEGWLRDTNQDLRKSYMGEQERQQHV